jgi:alpha-ketoglutarate-dependent taurine dioxygenase
MPMARSIRSSSPRAVDAAGELVRSTQLFGEVGGPPTVYSPITPDVDLASWAIARREQVASDLQRVGAVLFRGFPISDAEGFEHAADAISSYELYGEYGDLPRESAGDNVFTSTPYPDDLSIHFHNESSHLARWPRHIFFYCATPAAERGETPILDCREVCRRLDPALMSRFTEHGLTYIRNFDPGVDVSWQDFFRTADRVEVERLCAADETSCQWLSGERLRIRQSTAAVRNHPITGEQVFFNQILVHHPAALPQATRIALLDLCDEPAAFPRYVTFGDGTEIPDDVVLELIGLYDELAVRFPWEQSDLVMLDNMLVSHGRAPFVGPRRIMVAMAGMIGAT